jgi:hypothetical protein
VVDPRLASPQFKQEKYSSAAQQYFPGGAVNVYPIYKCRNCNLSYQGKTSIKEAKHGAIKRPEPCPRCFTLLPPLAIGTATEER